jgi:hypothetical protein
MPRKQTAIERAAGRLASAQRPSAARRIATARRVLALADLPPPDIKRWVVRRKAAVVAAVRDGLLSREEACRRYAIDLEEFESWQRSIDCFGVDGLRTTWTQFYLHCGARISPADAGSLHRAGR